MLRDDDAGVDISGSLGDVLDNAGTGTLLIGAVALGWLLLTGKDRAVAKVKAYRKRRKSKRGGGGPKTLFQRLGFSS